MQGNLIFHWDPPAISAPALHHLALTMSYAPAQKHDGKSGVIVDKDRERQ
jgi:hypothetical protein